MHFKYQVDWRQTQFFILVEIPMEHKADLCLSIISLFVNVVRVYVGLPSDKTSKHVYTYWFLFVMWICKGISKVHVISGGGRVMVFNATFNNISVIFVEDTRLPGEIRLASPWAGFKLTALVVIDTDCICVGSYKVNYLTITTTMTSIRIKICSVWFCVCLIIDKSIYLHVP